LDREFIKVSLGGMRDEAEIRGHRRTYVGAMPGRIVQGIKNAGTKNPVFMLDEIDKLGMDFRGDPSAALLEALDPEQNSEFSDHYLEVPFDLSEVIFITTANVLDTIPPALRDRLEIIRFAGYTEDEKYEIARRHLVEKVLKSNGLRRDKVEISASALKKIIKRYTKEAGVRSLEREISKAYRKVAKKFAEGKRAKVKINQKDVSTYLGPERFKDTLAEKKTEPGLATGLAWTQVGGDILFVEVALMPGKGRVTITGQLGDVMKESAKAAVSYVRSRWKQLKLDKEFYKSVDIHIHVPEGAVPKDGPSAGVTITSALVSALTNRPMKAGIGMTGEVTLRGRILEIGGVKEKVIAAHRSGLRTILMPKDNEKDLIEVPDEVKKDISFHFVDHMDKLFKIIF
jgi:ATP-dependent Lon protease